MLKENTKRYYIYYNYHTYHTAVRIKDNWRLNNEKKIELADVLETFATELKTPKKMKKFIDGANKAYNMTQDPDVIFSALRIIAMVNGNISKLARNAKIEHRSVYNMFEKGSNSTFRNIASISQNLGLNIHLSLSSACN
jgi:DNA-binding phage protein